MSVGFEHIGCHANPCPECRHFALLADEDGAKDEKIARLEEHICVLRTMLFRWVAEHEIARDGSEHPPESCERFARDRMTGDDCDLAIETRVLLGARPVKVDPKCNATAVNSFGAPVHFGQTCPVHGR